LKDSSTFLHFLSVIAGIPASKGLLFFIDSFFVFLAGITQLLWMNSDIDVLIFSTIHIPYKKWVIKEIKKRLPSSSKTLEKFKQFKARILATNVATSAAALRTKMKKISWMSCG
jgi:hypothetical protein